MQPEINKTRAINAALNVRFMRARQIDLNMNPLERYATRDIIHERNPVGDGRAAQASNVHLTTMVDGPERQPFPNSFVFDNTISRRNNLGYSILVCLRWYDRRLKGNVGSLELAWFNRWRNSSILDGAGIYGLPWSQGCP